MWPVLLEKKKTGKGCRHARKVGVGLQFYSVCIGKASLRRSQLSKDPKDIREGVMLRIDSRRKKTEARRTWGWQIGLLFLIFLSFPVVEFYMHPLVVWLCSTPSRANRIYFTTTLLPDVTTWLALSNGMSVDVMLADILSVLAWFSLASYVPAICRAKNMAQLAASPRMKRYTERIWLWLSAENRAIPADPQTHGQAK